MRARLAVKPPRAASGKGGIVPASDDDDGVSLGTVKLPGNIDIARFESLLFQVSLVRVVLPERVRAPCNLFRCLLERLMLFDAGSGGTASAKAPTCHFRGLSR